MYIVQRSTNDPCWQQVRSSGRSQSEEETAGTIFPTVLVLTKSDLLDDPRGRKKLQVRFSDSLCHFLVRSSGRSQKLKETAGTNFTMTMTYCTVHTYSRSTKPIINCTS